jgi:UDP-N-acetylglucosamine diphosphorylase / glucose-1-phosphate thymidylyltransferase / UDP-N-acetylgalactosamine diphosphorylase / glucosamine-1-phosphate N-acetyltransferase / galactosamine-1-phosphate N-acetyltransferase
MHVVIFEASRWHQFAPLSLSRPLFTIATGMTTLLQKQLRHLQPSKLTLWVRPQLEQFCRERVVPRLNIPTEINTPLPDELVMLVNGRTIHFGHVEEPEQESVMLDEEGLIRLAFVKSPELTPADAWNRTDAWLKLIDLPRMPCQSRTVQSIADLVHWNDESLMEDFAHLREPSEPKPTGPYHIVNDQNVWLGKGAKLNAGCVLDGSKGPVVIAEGASIGYNAVVQGPCYIGSHATITPLACIRPGTSIGQLSKVGGEVSMSIILGNSNKAHEGYLGHSYLGKWVNLGAGTTTSNLKNTYGEISLKTARRELSEGRRFLGSFLGDHAKTAIHTRLMAGTYVGFSSMLAGSGIAPKFVPSFTFWTDKGMEPYRLDKATEVAQRVFARRDRGWSPLDDQMMHYIADAAPGIEQ